MRKSCDTASDAPCVVSAHNSIRVQCTSTSVHVPIDLKTHICGVAHAFSLSGLQMSWVLVAPDPGRKSCEGLNVDTVQKSWLQNKRIC